MEDDQTGRAQQKLSPSKRLFVVASALVIGVTAVVVAAGGFAIWYSSRPKAPKPWNRGAITARYDGFGTEGEPPKFTFSYVLQNNTDEDYRVERSEQLDVMADLKSTNSLSPLLKDYLFVEPPIFVPARHRQKIVLHLMYTAPEKEPAADASPDEQKRFKDNVSASLRKNFINLAGFRAFDSGNRYEIEMPARW